MSLIVGLGNPGEEYAGTRHNIGFELADRMAEVLSVRFNPGKGPFLMGEAQFKGNPVRLIKPLTYMNRSGSVVKKALHQFHTPVDHCLVCYDDINLQPGALRLRAGG